MSARDHLRERFCDCPGHGLADDQHAPACHGLEVAAAATATVDPMMDPPRTWDENVMPSNTQLSDWLARCTPETRDRVVAGFMQDAETAARCFRMNHEGIIEDWRQLRERWAFRMHESWQAGHTADEGATNPWPDPELAAIAEAERAEAASHG